jgi:hypothetical protein
VLTYVEREIFADFVSAIETDIQFHTQNMKARAHCVRVGMSSENSGSHVEENW